MNPSKEITSFSYQVVYRATNLACRAHRHQCRKDGHTPYIAHLLRVAWVLRDMFGCEDPEVIAAAILHDAIEDTQADFDDILEMTTPRVAQLVSAVTKDMRLPEVERERAYDLQLMAAPWQARWIKLADIYDNLYDSLTNNSETKVAERLERALRLADGQPELAAAAQHLRALASAR